MPPDDKNPIAASAAAPPADSAPASAPPAGSSSQTAEPAAAAASPAPERPAAYEGSEPSLLQKTAANEPPKAEAKPAEAASPDGAKPAEGTQAPPKDAKVEDKTAKPGEAAKPEGDAAKPAEAKPAEPEKPAAPAPVEYKYALPETIKLDDAAKTQLHTVLDTFRADPANVQPLIDYHTERMAEHAKQVDAHNRTVFNEMRAENRKAIMADAVLGGSGHQTTSQAVARMRDLLVRKEFQQPRKFDDGRPRLSVLDEYLESTGSGDHLVMWDILHNAARYLDEPQANELPANPRPPKDLGKRPKGSIRDLYDHPRSNGQT
jgi:hypothetical protein